MKFRNLFIFMIALLIAGVSNGQTIHNPNIQSKITKEKIIELGNSAYSNKDVITLDFEGLGNQDEILNYYNAGVSGQGYSGNDYGIYFGGNTLSIIDEDAGGTGNFANEISPSTVMFFLAGSAVMNVSSGFVNGFSFYYASDYTGTIYVYDDVNATGNLLASISFPAIPQGVTGGDPNGYYDNWQPFGIAFEGTAKSIDFTGVQNHCAFDNVTFGSVNPPENVPPVVQGFPSIQPIELLIGETYNLTFTFHSPETNQTTTAVVDDFGLSNFDYTVTPGNICTVSLSLLATLDNAGTHTVEFTATDDGSPSLSTTKYLTFDVVDPSPAIINHPQSLNVQEGQPASFVVQASGANPLSYQWRKDGGTIPGANSNSYTITSVTEDDAGVYTCTVSNSFGEVTSNGAVLTISTGNVESMEWGSLVIYGNSFQNIDGTHWRASGLVSINELLQFDGNLDFDVDPFNLKAWGDCKIFMTGIPYLSTVDLYDGYFEFTLEGYLLNGLLDKANNLLEVAGLNARIDNIEIIPSKIDGVRIEGSLVLPKIFNQNDVNVEVEVTQLKITKSQGVQFEGSILVEDVEVKEVFGIEKLLLEFNTIDNNFHGEIEGLSAKVFTMGAEVDVINGKLDALGANLEPGAPKFPLGTTGFRISKIQAGVSGLAYSPLVMSAGIDLKPVAALGDFDLVALTDLNVSITWGESFDGSGNLTVFNKGVANVYLSISAGQVEFGGGVDLYGVLVGDINTRLTKLNSGIDFEGMMYAALSIPDGDGFPYGIINAIPFTHLPITLVEMENYIKNTQIAGNFSIGWFDFNYNVAYLNNDLDLDMATGHQNWNQILFNNKYLMFDELLNGQNRFEGLSLIINSENLNETLGMNRGVFEQSFNLHTYTPEIIVRLSESGKIPVYSILLPDGTVVDKTNVDNFGNIYYSENSEINNAYYTIKNPAVGEYVLQIEDNKNEIFVDVFGATIPPSLEILPLEQINGEQINIKWECDDDDSDATISLYYDKDNADADGMLIVSGISEDSYENSFFWDASILPTGEYYVYGIINDGENSPIISYSPNSVKIVNMLAPEPPFNLSGLASDTSIYLSWEHELSSGLKYHVYYTNNENESLSFASNSFNLGKTLEFNFKNFLPGVKYKFAVRAENSGGELSDFSNIIEVEYISVSLNNAPQIDNSQIDSKVYANTLYNMQFNCSDVDGDDLLYYILSNANGIVVNDDGLVSWNPTIDDVGVYFVNFYVEDTHGAKDSTSYQLIVLDYDHVFVDISFNSPNYNCFCDYGLVTVDDISFEGDPSSIDTILVPVFSKSDPYGILLKASESQPNSNVFNALFNFTNNPNDTDKLLVSENDSVWALYNNELKESVESTFSYFNLGEQEVDEITSWSSISSYINPDDPSLENLMNEGVTNGNIIIMLGKSGIFWPGQNINTIGDWNPHEAYKIKMLADDKLKVSGALIENKSVQLTTGISFLPVLSTYQLQASYIFSQIEEEMLFAFDIVNSLVYWPEGGIYTLETLEPGKGYLVGMLAAGTVSFPETKGLNNYDKPQKQIVENAPWTVDNTGIAHIVSVYNSALADLQNGDIVAVFNSEEVCVGMAQYGGKAENLALLAYGDDFTTEAIDGMIEDELMYFAVYRPSTNETIQVQPSWDVSMTHSGIFAENGLSAITSLKLGALGFDDETLKAISIYPNPSSGLFNLHGIESAVHITVLNSTGQEIQKFQTSTSTQIDLSKVSKGIYFVKMISENAVRVEKIIVE